MIIENAEALKTWIISRLENICNGDPVAVSKYVLALVKKDKNENELYKFCLEQLDIFLLNDTKIFVDMLFETLRTKSYLILPKSQNLCETDSHTSSVKCANESPSTVAADKSAKKQMHAEKRQSLPLSDFTKNLKEEYRPKFYKETGSMQCLKDHKKNFEKEWISEPSKRQERYVPVLKERGENLNFQQHPVECMGYEPKEICHALKDIAYFMNKNITGKKLQRCQDYHERGYCMRGDLCQLDHGSDPVIVDHVSMVNFGSSLTIVLPPPLPAYPPTEPPPLPSSPPPSTPPPPLSPLALKQLPPPSSPLPLKLQPQQSSLFAVKQPPPPSSPLALKQPPPPSSPLALKQSLLPSSPLPLKQPPQPTMSLPCLSSSSVSATPVLVPSSDSMLVPHESFPSATVSPPSFPVPLSGAFGKPPPLKEPASYVPMKPSIRKRKVLNHICPEPKPKKASLEPKCTLEVPKPKNVKNILSSKNLVSKFGPMTNVQTFNKRLELHKKKQEYLETQIRNEKALLTELSKAKSEKTKVFLKKAIQDFASKIALFEADAKKSYEELMASLKNFNTPVPKSENEKELLDVEMDLYNKQHKGEDTTELLSRLNNLRQRVKGLEHVAPSTPLTVGVNKKRRFDQGFPNQTKLLRLSKHMSITKTDSHLKTSDASGFKAKIANKKPAGQVVKKNTDEVDENVPGIITESRKSFEMALLQEKQLENENVQSTNSEEKTDSNTDKENKDSLHMLDDDDDEEEDSESRSWRR